MVIKKIMPLFAIALGLVLAVVTSGFKELANENNEDPMYTFEYTGPSDYSLAHIKDIANWTFRAVAPDCAGNQKACSISVNEDFVNSSGSTPVLKFSINIQGATNPITNTSYVTALDDPDGLITNQLAN